MEPKTKYAPPTSEAIAVSVEMNIMNMSQLEKPVSGGDINPWGVKENGYGAWVIEMED